MGFHADELERIERLLQSREGLILVTGPTGSGKTTTLYAALRRLKERGVNIVTVEDPIEYRLPGIVQVQVNEKAGLTFASALRSIMRQDPDVVLIGEIRDRETAEIAIQASLTGHLVLSTLHTNDAPSAVTRLIDIGVASYKIATAVKGVLAQRLVRRLCASCRGVDRPRAHECGGSGFHGRLALVEVLVGSPEFERRVAAGESTERIAEAARADGMRTLWKSGVAHAAAGRTTIDEVLRVATPDDEPRVAPSRLRAAAPRDLPGARARDEPDLRRRRVSICATTSTSWSREPVRRRRSFRAHGTRIEVGTVDVFVDPSARRPAGACSRCSARTTRAVRRRGRPVHGHIEPGEEPEDAAVREVREETGLAVERLYNVRVQPFYLHKLHVVQLAIVFAAFVAEPATVVDRRRAPARRVAVGRRGAARGSPFPASARRCARSSSCSRPATPALSTT